MSKLCRNNEAIETELTYLCGSKLLGNDHANLINTTAYMYTYMRTLAIEYFVLPGVVKI